MDNNASNPFGDWTFVWLSYCDGEPGVRALMACAFK